MSVLLNCLEQCSHTYRQGASKVLKTRQMSEEVRAAVALASLCDLQSGTPEVLIESNRI